MNQPENPDNPMVLLRRLHHWRMAFFGLVILLAGMLSGAAVTLLTVRHLDRAGPLPIEGAVTTLIRGVGPRLHLSAEQVQQIQPILEKHVTRLHEIWADGRTQIVEELRAMNDEVLPVLDENQQRLWHQYLQDLPGPFRHGGGPPHLGLGPAPGRGFGPGGRFGFRRGVPGEPNAAPPARQEGPVHVN
jgi:hypothetical protein